MTGSKIGKGLGAIKDAMNSSTTQLKLKSGESTIIRIVTPADEIISVYEHVEQLNGKWETITCIGRNDCPLCQAGKRAAFKSYLVVVDLNDGNKVKIFKASKRVGVQLLGLIEEYGDITKRDFKIFRQGEKLDTTYQFFPRDPSDFDFSSVEVPDVEKMVQPLSREAILNMMNGSSNEGTDTDVPNSDTGDSGDDDFPF